MMRSCKRVCGWFGEWRRYCLLLALLFAARGVLVLCILPPFEGWDEYQHLAYVVHMIEKGSPPDLASGSVVPRSMFPWLIEYPHCRFATDQLRVLGAKSYDGYWTDPTTDTSRLESAPDIPIYQAQHPSLYYRMMMPVVRWFLPRGDIRSLMGWLRLINVAFGALSIYVAGRLIGVLIRPSRLRYLLGLLIALQPLYLLNCARVASDALAVLLGTAAIGLILVPSTRHRVLGSVWTGMVTGLSILAKTVNMAIAPFAVGVALAQGVWRRADAAKALGSAAAMIVGLLLICGTYFYHNLTTFGLLTPMQEAVQNRAAGRTMADALETARNMNIVDELGRRFYRRSLWTGGWSYLQPPAVAVKVQEYGYYFASLGFLFALMPTIRRSRGMAVSSEILMRVFALILLTAAGLCYHMVHTRMLLGSVATNIWYAAVIFPWLLVLYVQGLAFWPLPRLGFASGVILAGTYLLTELYATIVTMTASYTGGATGWEAWHRIALLHPAWLSPPVAVIAAVFVLIFVAVATGVMAGGVSGLDVVHEENGQRSKDNDRQPGR